MSTISDSTANAGDGDQSSLTIALQTPAGEPDYCDAVVAQLQHFNGLTDTQKTQLILLASQGLNSLAQHDNAAKVAEPAIDPVKAEVNKLRFWTTMIVLGFVFLNVTAVVTAILVIGVRTGKLPEFAPVTALISLALEILKTVFAA